ncbi:MAG: choice-of-anchor V domain-containing protein [Aureispira sp.]
MKKINFLMALMFGAAGLLLLQSSSAGRAASGGLDRTGSPVAGGVCSQCHNGGSFSPTASATITNAAGTAVTAYVPGQTYTVTFTVTGSGASGYAMQASMLDANNANAGDFLANTTSNTRLTTVAATGIEFLEHQGLQAAGTFAATWEAPAAGTGTVTLYGVGLACNGNGGTTGDQVTAAISVALTEDNSTNVNNIEGEIALFDVYPMPNQGNFTLKNNSQETDFQLQIVNMAGQVVAAQQLNLAQSATQTLDFPNLVPGLYTVILEGENLRQAQQMMVAK